MNMFEPPPQKKPLALKRRPPPPSFFRVNLNRGFKPILGLNTRGTAPVAAAAPIANAEGYATTPSQNRALTPPITKRPTIRIGGKRKRTNTRKNRGSRRNTRR